MILVLGKNGQLSKSIYKVSSLKSNQFWGSEELNLEITDKIQAKLETFRPKLIINTTSFNNVDDAEDENSSNFKINFHAIKEITDFCKRTNSGLIHVSTDYVFDGKKDNEYDELDIPKPINKYGKAKLEGENYIRSNLKNFYIIRTSWLYSEYEKDTNFLHKIIQSITSGNMIFGAEDIYGSPTYSGDLAHAIMLLVNKNLKCNGETFHFCNNGYVSRYKFIQAIVSIVSRYGHDSDIKKAKSKDFPQIAKRPLRSVLSPKKIESYLNIQIPLWDDSLEKAIKNYLNNSLGDPMSSKNQI